MSTIFDYLVQAEFSLAAYANLSTGVPKQDELIKAGMSADQAAQFAATYSVVAQYSDSATGLSATVFADAAGNRYLAIRGTQPSLSDLTADYLLASGIPASLNPQFSALKAEMDIWLADPNVLQGKSFTVTGHSLGGYLAAAVAQEYGAQVTDAYLFNSPGMYGVLGTIADSFMNFFGLSGTPVGNIWNIQGSSGLSIISGLGDQLGQAVTIQTDAAPGLGTNNHSIVRLNNSLAVYNLFAELDPTLNSSPGIQTISDILQASTNQTNRTLENALDALRILFNAPNASTPTPTDNNNQFYQNLTDLQSTLNNVLVAHNTGTTTQPNYNLTVRDLSVMFNTLGSAQIASIAQSNLAYSYALVNLNSFAVTGNDAIYTQFDTTN